MLVCMDLCCPVPGCEWKLDAGHVTCASWLERQVQAHLDDHGLPAAFWDQVTELTRR